VANVSEWKYTVTQKTGKTIGKGFVVEFDEFKSDAYLTYKRVSGYWMMLNIKTKEEKRSTELENSILAAKCAEFVPSEGDHIVLVPDLNDWFIKP